MRRRPVPVPALAAVLAAALAVGCTDGSGEQAPPSPMATDATASTTGPEAGTATRTTTASDTTAASPSLRPTSGVEQLAFGTGIATVDGTDVAVSGDCDVSRSFGEEPVTGLDDDVDVLLAVDNVTGDGTPTGPFALQVRLLGDGAVEGRSITSEGAPGPDGGTVSATYEGTVEVAELRDRRELEFLDVATLHLEATQQRVAGDAGPAQRQLVVDVTCPISRPE